MPWLRKEGVVRILHPTELRSINDELTVAATLSDLSDESWVARANPRPYGLPTQKGNDGTPNWNIFQAKMPDRIVELLTNDNAFSHHIISEGDEGLAWVLSYAAGSAIGINTHLAAAEEIQYAPITDSRLHHELMLMKLARSAVDASHSRALECYVDQVSQRAIMKIVGQVLPAEYIERLSLEDILDFRNRTNTLRDQLVEEVRTTVLSKIDVRSTVSYIKTESEVSVNILKSLKIYGDEVASARDRMWPKLIEGMVAKSAVGATAVGLAASYISGSGYVLAASLAVHALQPLKAALDWRADVRKVNRSAATGVAYLSQVASLRRR